MSIVLLYMSIIDDCMANLDRLDFYGKFEVCMYQLQLKVSIVELCLWDKNYQQEQTTS
mgnify:CR=1 FL=1